MTNTLFDINFFDADCTIKTYKNFEDDTINILSDQEY